MARLIHITPELPPTVGGVADYTAILSQRLVEVSDGAVEPVLIRAGWKEERAPETDFETVDLGGQCSSTALASVIQALADDVRCPTVVLLEYSGYGYAKRGAPLWLLRALRKACGEEGVPLITMFHEVRARNWQPWTSTFWLSPIQTHVARGLARLSRRLLTNHETAAHLLQSLTLMDTAPDVYPVFSNVGEPHHLSRITERTVAAAVFGGAGMKERLYSTHGKLLARWAAEANVQKIIDLGLPPANKPVDFPVAIDWRGVQTKAEVSAVLSKSCYGILHYPGAYMTKSGIMAAYMAHGTTPVVVAPEPQGGALEPSVHYIPVTEERVASDIDSSTIAAAASNWYAKHAHSCKTARIVHNLLHNMHMDQYPDIYQ